MNILIVDDSRAMRMIILKTLRESGFGDHNFSEASDGLLALEHVKAHKPDLILADWNMPNMDGPSLLKELKSIKCNATFGFITTEATSQRREFAREIGAEFLISKPFTPESFSQTLSKYIS